MPFPLHALDYGSRCRLRELVTPREAYDLQIAAPHFDGLKPIQTILRRYSGFTSVRINDDNEFYADFMTKDMNNDKLYLVKNHLRIAHFTSNHSAQLITDRFVLAPSQLMFIECDITAKFLQDLCSKTTTNISKLDFMSGSFHDDVTLELVCTLFKELRDLNVFDNFFTRTWIDTFISHKFTNMTNISVYEASIDLLKVEEKQLIEFMQAQDSNFKVGITLKGNCGDSEVQKILGDLFSKFFWDLKEFCSDGRQIAISWVSSKDKKNLNERYYVLRNYSDIISPNFATPQEKAPILMNYAPHI
uniref:F-box domain-containing protein n=1 Tax=Panagrellus redivivus TaxID=6233 RepID=A0A7E4ZS51_PANRE